MRHRTITNPGEVQPAILVACCVGVILLVTSTASTTMAQQQGGKNFSSPQAAIQALFTGVQNDDEQGIRGILGGDSDLVSSQNNSQDKRERQQFAGKYREMHRLVQESDGTMFLYIGAENWPFPVPLVSKAGQWYFDAEAGKQEIVYRQVGENEITAIETCRALVSVKKEGQTGDNPIVQYAQRFSSVSQNIGDNGGSADREEPSNLFHGYYFQSTRPGQAGDSKRKVFAFVAYPAEYRSTGVMTFVVDRNGVVYEKDLGANTQKLAKEIPPSQSLRRWHQVELQ